MAFLGVLGGLGGDHRMSIQQLCVTVTAPTMAELRRQRDGVGDADLIELRLDSVCDPDVSGALADRRRPVMITCRPAWDGGAFVGSEEERKRLLREALASGAEYVDLEAGAGFDDLIADANRHRVVISAHDFEEVPADLDARIRAMKATGAHTVKIAVKTNRLADCVTLLEIASRWQDADGRHGLVLIGMGEHGAITRVWPSRFHSSWTYAGTLAGVGQITPGALLNEFRFRDLGPHTALYGIAGAPVAHSVSPAMHNAAFRAASIDGVYLPLPAVDVDDFVAFARAFGLQGANVTIPYKVAICARVDETSELAARIGAINAIRVEGHRWLGDNTDAQGFLEPLRDRLPLTGTRAALLGAGGAARGVAIALATSGAHVSVHARNRQRAGEVAALVSGSVGAWPPEPASWDLLVNCTPVGMHPHVDESPLPASHLASGTVYDLVYNPQATRLLTEAERAGCRTIGGLEMLVGQARQAFEWWTGVRPSAAVMRSAAVNKLSEFVEHENHVA
jgi:3-dehydroquinate dehydratase/shikimate dehydrogenase